MSDEMRCGHLGRSGLLVSRIGLGTMALADRPDDAIRDALVELDRRALRLLAELLARPAAGAG